MGFAENFFPTIEQTIGQKDILFKQLEREVRQYYRTEAAGQPPPPLGIYQYVLERPMDLLEISGYFGLPYEGLITLNRFENNRTLNRGEKILIPNQPGLFAYLEESSPLEEMIIMRLGPFLSPRELNLPTQRGVQKVLFWPGEKFHPIERSYFLKILFQPPLASSRLTSSYGFRPNPFTGHRSFHNGIDLAAPLGTEVYAAREGSVIETGEDEVLGLYILIDHYDGYQTLYGHLKKTNVFLNQEIPSGMIIGEVGLTGMTTGPHLHFEIRHNNESRDPLSLIRKSY